MLTVLIATFNGAGTLPRTLDALERLTSPMGSWKLVIVDNGSTDASADIIRSRAESLPLTYVLEPRRGQNVARNAGLKHVVGDLLVLTDDDVVPEPDWLATMRATADSHPDYAMFAGRIVPQWPAVTPEWILRCVDLAVCFAVTSADQREGPVPANAVWSPNMALRRTIFQAGLSFDEEVGPNGTLAFAMGSESDLTTRAESAGFKAWFSERAVVHHQIRPFQLEREWILGRAVRYGMGMSRRQLKRGISPPPAMLFGFPRHLLMRIARRSVRAALMRPFAKERWFREKWEEKFLVGWASEVRRFYSARGHADQR